MSDAPHNPTEAEQRLAARISNDLGRILGDRKSVV